MERRLLKGGDMNVEAARKVFYQTVVKDQEESAQYIWKLVDEVRYAESEKDRQHKMDLLENWLSTYMRIQRTLTKTVGVLFEDEPTE